MSCVTDEKFCDGDPVWVWTFGAYYPGVIESLTTEPGTCSAMIRWAAEAEDVPAAASTRVLLDDMKPFADGLHLGITTTVEEVFYPQMLAEGFDHVLERCAGSRTRPLSVAKANLSTAAMLPSMNLSTDRFHNVEPIPFKTTKTKKRKQVKAIRCCVLAAQILHPAQPAPCEMN